MTMLEVGEIRDAPLMMLTDTQTDRHRSHYLATTIRGQLVERESAHSSHRKA